MFVFSQPDHPSYSLEFVSGVSQLFPELALCLRGGKIGPPEDVQYCIEHGLWRPKSKWLFPAISMRTELKEATLSWVLCVLMCLLKIHS